MRWCVVVLLVFFLVGCDRNDLLKLAGHDRASLMRKMTPPYEEGLAMLCVDLLREGKYEEITERLDPSIVNAGTHDKLVAVAKLFPDQEPVSAKTIDASVSHEGDAIITSVTSEYEFAPEVKSTSGSTELLPRRWLFVELVTQNVGGLRTITGLRVTPSSESVETINAFTFKDKGVPQYAALCLAMLVSTFGLYAFVVCVRTKMGKGKWLWLPLILIGVGKVTVNWTTGQWSFTPLSLSLQLPLPPGGTINCSPYGPWIVCITAPFGAIAFLQYRKRLTRPVASAVVDVSEVNGMQSR
jgi:hypothetical protein